MELSAQEQTLLATFRSLDETGRMELLRLASRQRQAQAAAAETPPPRSGHCRTHRNSRPEIASEPIFTE